MAQPSSFGPKKGYFTKPHRAEKLSMLIKELNKGVISEMTVTMKLLWSGCISPGPRSSSGHQDT